MTAKRAGTTQKTTRAAFASTALKPDNILVTVLLFLSLMADYVVHRLRRSVCICTPSVPYIFRATDTIYDIDSLCLTSAL